MVQTGISDFDIMFNGQYFRQLLAAHIKPKMTDEADFGGRKSFGFESTNIARQRTNFKQASNNDDEFLTPNEIKERELQKKSKSKNPFAPATESFQFCG